MSARKLARYMDRAEMAQREAAQAAEAALEAQRLKDKQQVWDTNWDLMRGGVPGIAGPEGNATRLRQGEKIIIPEG